MGSEVVQTKYEELETIARRFAQQAQANRALQQQVQRGVAALRNGGWEGRGAFAFFGEMEQQVFPVLARLTNALAEAQATTLVIKEIIRQAEEEAARVFRGDAYANTDNGSDVELNSSTPYSEIDKSKFDGFSIAKAVFDFVLGFLVIGDVWDILNEGVIKPLTGRERDEFVMLLAGLGLTAELAHLLPTPGAEDAPNVGLSALKAIAKMVPAGAARDALLETIEQGFKNPQQASAILESLTKLGKNGDLLQTLIKNPDVLNTVLKDGPDALDLLVRHGDEGVQLVKNIPDKGIDILRTYDPKYAADIPGGSLLAQEGKTIVGAKDTPHTIREHIAKTPEELTQRLVANPHYKNGTSSFTDLTKAEESISMGLRNNPNKISEVLNKNDGATVVFTHDVGSPIGTHVLKPGDPPTVASKVRVVLIRDSLSPSGYRIYTAFPTVR